MTKESKNKTQQNSSRQDSKPQIQSDSLFKKIMINELAAREFLSEYLPRPFQELVDLSKITIENESFVAPELKRRLSDIVYSVELKTSPQENIHHQVKLPKTRKVTKALIYVLIEHQSEPNYWISFRLMEYLTLLLAKHVKPNKRTKLPLILPIVFYNGLKPYNVPLNIWELFTHPQLAKETLTNDYQLVNLQNTTIEQIKPKKHLGMMEYFMKHIQHRDMIQLWQNFFHDCPESVIVDAERGYLYLKLMLTYTEKKLALNSKEELSKLILDNLPTNTGEAIMRTIADEYINEGKIAGIEQGRIEGIEKGIVEGIEKGIEKGRVEGIEKGIVEGIEKGIEKGRVEAMKQTAIKMFRINLDLETIKLTTGLPTAELTKIKNNISQY